MIKNISKAEVLVLKDQVAYQEGQVVSKTLAQNDALSVTLFSFDKGEEISTHESGGDAFVTCLDGVGEITINGEKYELICFIKKAQQKTLRNGEFFVVVIITKGMRVKCTPKSDFGVLLYEGGDSCCSSTI